MSTPESIAFLNGSYQEALKLTCEARDYLAYGAPGDQARLAPRARLVASCESLRITARLTQVMAWLLVQKAVEAGEVTRAEAAAPEYRLGGQGVCTASLPLDDLALPPRLTGLLERSLSLYERVARLDAMMGEAADG